MYSQYVKTKLTDFIFTGGAFAPPTSWYIGVNTGTVSNGDAGLINEPAGGYTRVAYSGNWARGGDVIMNVDAIEFPVATAAWPVVNEILLYDQDGVFFGSMEIPDDQKQVIPVGDYLAIAPMALEITS